VLQLVSHTQKHTHTHTQLPQGSTIRFKHSGVELILLRVKMLPFLAVRSPVEDFCSLGARRATGRGAGVGLDCGIAIVGVTVRAIATAPTTAHARLAASDPSWPLSA
jgi:hypothetical protein